MSEQLRRFGRAIGLPGSSATVAAPAGGSFWYTTGDPGPPRPPLEGRVAADVAIIGGGFTGLWTAIRLVEADPALRVVLLEADRVAEGASGRNGGFCAASLTHGLHNGLLHFADELERLEAEGVRNLRELVAFVRNEGIDAELEETGTLDVATEPWQVDGLAEYVALAAAHAIELAFLDRDAIQALVHSSRFQAGVRGGPERCVLVNPAKLAWGLATAAERRGVRIAEESRVRRLARRAGRVEVHVEGGAVVDAEHVVVGTSAYSAWMRRLATAFVPVYDYALMTEPMTTAQRDSIGWGGREGMSDAGNQFHYFRQSADHRILWGGYDAIYHPGNAVKPSHDLRPSTFDTLARQFVETFPQLDGIGFTHRWGGAIDTSTRFSVTFGETLGGRVHYALGYTGLGVGATRWAAGVLRDMVLDPSSDLLRLRFVRSTPFPIPLEPIRTPAVEIMRRSVIAADAHEGRRGMFLQAMDALGIGFDS
ncbi:MAG TPA: FAD-dependent oxidoreductase [Candidatus Limnocylindrales bacterium]|nr:FAD-dependent oxidoreductase [Candidatus Limnocylindrales bacterium]